MKVFANFFIGVIVLGTICGCVDTIDLPGGVDISYVVINGQITNERKPYIITVSQSATNGELSEQKITGALVSIKSTDGAVEVLTEYQRGSYRTDSTQFIGIIGNSYVVEVVLDDGRIYQSSPEKLLPVPPIQKLDFDFVKEAELNEIDNIVFRKRVKIKINTVIPDNPENVYFKWDVTGEYEFKESEALTDIFATTGVGTFLFTCFVQDPVGIGDISIFDGSNAASAQLQSQQIKSIEVDYKFTFNYCVHVKQQSLTQGAYEFWRSVKESTERSGELFERNPGQITGNIRNVSNSSEKVLGYFYASAVVNDKLFISPDSVEKPVSPCLVIDPDFESACMDCLELARSTREVPSYWPR